MKKVILLAVSLYFMPICAWAVGINMCKTPLLSSEDSFIVAKAVKLGTEENKIFGADKEILECLADADCPSGFFCQGNKCFDKCLSLSCAPGNRCFAGNCVPCDAGAEDCDCTSPAVADGKGACTGGGCAADVMAARNDVAAAEDSAGLTTALASGKNIILVTKSFDLSSTVNLGSKKLVGPKYFTSTPSCVSEETPTLNFTQIASTGISMSSGEINKINLKSSITSTNTTNAVIRGSGTITDVSGTLVNKPPFNYINATGAITFTGTNKLDSQVTEINTRFLTSSSGALMKVQGTVTIDGIYRQALLPGGGLHITSTGSLVYNGTSYYEAIVINGDTTIDGSFIVNGDASSVYTASSSTAYSILDQRTGAMTIASSGTLTFNESSTRKNYYGAALFIKGDRITINGKIVFNKGQYARYGMRIQNTTFLLNSSGSISFNEKPLEKITTDSGANLYSYSSTMNINGPIYFNQGVYNLYGFRTADSNVTIGSTGSLTFAGDGTVERNTSDKGGYFPDHDIYMSGGTFTTNGPIIINREGNIGIRTLSANTFIANAPIKINKKHRTGIDISSNSNVFELNGSGNLITTVQYGITNSQNYVRATINGSTTIAMEDDSTVTFRYPLNLSSYGMVIKINAPITVTGLKKPYKDMNGEKDYLIMIGSSGSFELNSKIESTSGVGTIFLRSDAGRIKSGAQLLGADALQNAYGTATVEAGAKLSIRGVCKSAGSTGTLAITYGATSPVSPFTGGC